MTITINSTEVQIKNRSLSIRDNLNTRNICSFVLDDPLITPQIGNVVDISDKFAGTIDRIQKKLTIKGNTKLSYNIACVSYDQICDRRKVQQVYQNQTIDVIVKDIVDNFLSGEGVTYSNVEAGPTIKKVVFNYDSVTKAFDDLAELVGYDWYIDNNKDLHFFSRESNTGTELNDNNILNMSIIETRNQYRNIQYTRAGYGISEERTDTFAGDGKKQTFTCKLPLAKVPTITVNSITKTVGIFGLETSKDFYWSKGQKEIVQDDSGTKLISSDTLSITYQGLFPIIARSDLGEEIANRSAIEGGTGIYEDVADDKSIEDTDAAQQKTEALLRKYGTIPQTLDVSTLTEYKAGQIVIVNSTLFGISGNYLVQSATIKQIGINQLVYDVKLLSGENIGGWESFFKSLVESGKQFVIRENEVLLRIVQFSEDITITDSMTTTAAAPESRAGYAKVGFSEVA